MSLRQRQLDSQQVKASRPIPYGKCIQTAPVTVWMGWSLVVEADLRGPAFKFMDTSFTSLGLARCLHVQWRRITGRVCGRITAVYR